MYKHISETPKRYVLIVPECVLSYFAHTNFRRSDLWSVDVIEKNK